MRKAHHLRMRNINNDNNKGIRVSANIFDEEILNNL